MAPSAEYAGRKSPECLCFGQGVGPAFPAELGQQHIMGVGSEQGAGSLPALCPVLICARGPGPSWDTCCILSLFRPLSTPQGK